MSEFVIKEIGTIHIYSSQFYISALVKKPYVCKDSVSWKSLYSRQAYPLYQQLSVYLYRRKKMSFLLLGLRVTALPHLSSLHRDLPEVFVSIVDMPFPISLD